MEDALRRRVSPRFMVASRRPSSLAVTPFHLLLEKSDARAPPCATGSHVVDVFLPIFSSSMRIGMVCRRPRDVNNARVSCCSRTLSRVYADDVRFSRLLLTPLRPELVRFLFVSSRRLVHSRFISTRVSSEAVCLRLTTRSYYAY